MKVALSPRQSDFFHIRKITFFSGHQKSGNLVNVFWHHEKAISFGFGKLAFSWRQKTENYLAPWRTIFVSGLENSIFQGTKRLEFSSRLFWRHEKAISFGFEKLAFSECNNADSFHWRNKKPFSFRFGIFVLQGAKTQKITWKLLW